MAHQLVNFAGGALDAAVSAADTTFQSPGLADLPSASPTSPVRIALETQDADGRTTAAELVDVVSGASGAQSRTVVRAREGTMARAWPRKARWAAVVSAATLAEAATGPAAVPAEFYSTGLLITSVQANPRPTSDTLVPGMTLSVPGAVASRTFVIHAVVSADFATGGNVRATLLVNGVRYYPNDDNSGATNNTLTFGAYEQVGENGLKMARLSGLPLTIPGDGVARTISIVYNAVGTTAGMYWTHRYLTMAQVGV